MKNTVATPLDWSKVLSDEARLTDVVLVNAIATKYRLPLPSAQKALSRLADRGLLIRVAKGIYVNSLVRDSGAEDFIKLLRPDSYVSLESALSHCGLSTQSSVALTCVTTGKPKEFATAAFAITFRTISKRLYWGFIEKQTRYSKYAIAEPEKAVLDWIYLTLQGGLTPSLDEIEFKVIDKQKLAKYAVKYPGTVRNTLMHSLAFEHFAA